MMTSREDFKLEKGPTDKAKEPDPGGSDQQNLGFKKLKKRITDRTVSFSVFQFFDVTCKPRITADLPITSLCWPLSFLYNGVR